ncbi:hypothetical protein GZ22_18325 (plasmid) [Terribacillus saccharophilus]|uniref:Conjugal transfer protein n=1 Tax=Terribacillus saccharophilus TaxID=361277 RepID=A0A075LVA2_9BACI|nr:hypothetical protein [Terribacillus goriensis]AIF68393.1 hypothetical protein GZ22_18325 [Terribacillus goriensis]
MDQDQIKQALLELIDSDTRKGRKWFFPKNVDNQYKIFMNMTFKELALFVLPSLLLSGGIAFIPPYSSTVFWFIKSFLIVFILVIPVFYVNYRPVKFRENLRAKDFIKEILDFRKKKKMYFVRPKDRSLIK